VFSPTQGASSETFIRAHIERLPLPTVAIYGGGWRRFGEHGALWPLLRYPGGALVRITPLAGRALYARALACALQRLRIDVALAEYGMTGAEILDACRRASIPLVVYFFGIDAWRESIIRVYLPRYKRMFASAAAIIAVSDSIRQRLLEWGAPIEKTHHVVCGADVQRFSGAAPDKAEPRFVAVGRFTEKKAPQLTVRAFRGVVAVEPKARLTMIGDGPLFQTTRRLVTDLGLERNVELPGIRTPEDVASLYRGARAFVQHSITAADGDREGTPVAILEAQMAGLPVVSTRHSGIPEIVADGETGMLVEEGDVVAMGQAMTRLAKDSALAGMLGRAGRERALRHFSLDHSLSKLTRILELAASGGRP
jgi:glycosyltransferase involved in cell wall biosynthesis